LFDWEGFVWQTSRCNYPHDTTVNSSSSGSHPHQEKDKKKKISNLNIFVALCFLTSLGALHEEELVNPWSIDSSHTWRLFANLHCKHWNE
jgi:hypothetical protein